MNIIVEIGPNLRFVLNNAVVVAAITWLITQWWLVSTVKGRH